VPEGKTVSSEFCVQLLERLLKCISQRGPQLRNKSTTMPLNILT